MRPTGTCALCREERLLCDSHLLPKAIYRLMRAPDLKNPNPVHVVRDGAAVATSKQITDYLLCEECEQQFRRCGEDWAMAQCYRDGSFKLRESLRAIAPLSANPNIQVYRGTDIPGTEQLVYFAMSVFWRAAVHHWRELGQDYQIDLGPYQEPIRPYLLGKAGFPDKTLLHVRISAAPDEYINFAYRPHTRNNQGFHVHRFVVPGILFMLVVGGQIPPRNLPISTAPASERFLAIHVKSEEDDIMAISQVVQSAKPRAID